MPCYLKLIDIFFQISGYPEIYLQCTVDDQKLLSIFEVDTGPYRRQKFSYRKRTEKGKGQATVS